jgi:hypothetical protein
VVEGGGNTATFDNLKDVRTLEYEVDFFTNKSKVGKEASMHMFVMYSGSKSHVTCFPILQKYEKLARQLDVEVQQLRRQASSLGADKPPTEKSTRHADKGAAADKENVLQAASGLA